MAVMRRLAFASATRGSGLSCGNRSLKSPPSSIFLHNSGGLQQLRALSVASRSANRQRQNHSPRIPLPTAVFGGIGQRCPGVVATCSLVLPILGARGFSDHYPSGRLVATGWCSPDSSPNIPDGIQIHPVLGPTPEELENIRDFDERNRHLLEPLPPGPHDDPRGPPPPSADDLPLMLPSVGPLLRVERFTMVPGAERIVEYEGVEVSQCGWL